MATLKLNEEIINIIEKYKFYNKVEGIDNFPSYIKGYTDEVLCQFPIYGIFKKEVLEEIKENFILMTFGPLNKTYEFYFSFGIENHAIASITTQNNEVKVVFSVVCRSNKFYIDFYRKISNYIDDQEQKKAFGFESAIK